MTSLRRHFSRVIGLGLALPLASCAVGPDFVAPAPPDVERFTPEPTASPGGGQRFREGAEVSARWWEAFHSQQSRRSRRGSLGAQPDARSRGCGDPRRPVQRLRGLGRLLSAGDR